jgi:hypothetical protein
MLWVMGRVERVPGWVRHRVADVAAVEDYLLSLHVHTGSSPALGGWSALHWLAELEPGESWFSPFGWVGPPELGRVAAEVQIAGSVAAGDPYPDRAWWDGIAVPPVGRLPPSDWRQRISRWSERDYARGVAGGLAWLVGAVADPSLCAPVRDRAGQLLPDEDRAGYRWCLQELAGGRRPRLLLPPRGRRAVHRPSPQSLESP